MNRVQKAAMDQACIRKQAPQLADLIGKMTKAKVEGKDPYSVSIPPHLQTKAQARVGASRGTNPSGRKSRAKSQPENLVKTACLQWLKGRGIFAWRNNTGMAWIGEHPIRFGLPGSGDILGLLPDGRFLSVECKSASGRQSDTQKRFEGLIRQNHGIYLLAYSVTDLEEGLRAEGYSFDPGLGGM